MALHAKELKAYVSCRTCGVHGLEMDSSGYCTLQSGTRLHGYQMSPGPCHAAALTPLEEKSLEYFDLAYSYCA